jgi:hypothetical protein
VVIPRVAQPPKEHLPDYEVELVIVIGKAAKDVSEADALDYVLGYTGANDVIYAYGSIIRPRNLHEYLDRFLSANTNWPSRNGASPKDSVRLPVASVSFKSRPPVFCVLFVQLAV